MDWTKQQEVVIGEMINESEFIGFEKGIRYEKSEDRKILLKKLILTLPNRLRQKIKVLFRDNFKCVNCDKNNKLHIHHIDENKQNNNINNLVILCASCHLSYHKRGFF